MNKKYIIAIFTVLLLISGYFLYGKFENGIPSDAPVTVIKHNGNIVPTSLGDHNWVSKEGGSSYETGGEYTVGLNTSKFNAKFSDKIHIFIPQNPLRVRIDKVSDNNYKHTENTVTKEGKEYIFTLPSQKGEYVFKVFAEWDSDRHNTATIFRVLVE